VNDTTALVIVGVIAMFLASVVILGILALILGRFLKIKGQADKEGAKISVSTLPNN
jgi:hypothetical protein